ncbi:autotransporter domain-containing protein [Ancylobacter sp. WKF20]|uniref:autotransporter outer membrane beta-barrel domain-containing protein n=1 Tax=Ancylobacter sp. WKF20 TaxID=3039801 RepID=UPI002434145A|nr:autotransporter domain-containing protein [Ancylobacter sp. WKF20]WGD30652.1 autotransporter domain-containing protein [Ancylobacter sp. WKF20]
MAVSALWGGGFVSTAAAYEIPLSYDPAPSNNSYRLTITVGVGGALPQTYLFDTGSSAFNADFNFTAGSAPASFTPVTSSPSPFYFTYGDAGATHGFYETAIGVNEISFYRDVNSPAVTTITTPGSGFLMGDIEYPVIITYDSDNNPIYTPTSETAGDAKGLAGTFGAANATTDRYGNVLFGGILGQATTSGYVIAANCHSEGAGCNPHVILDLTPAIRAQFDSVFQWSTTGSPFPVSGANSAGLYSITLNYTVIGSGNTGTYPYSAATLLDSGTNTYNLYLNSSVSSAALNALATLVVSDPQTDAVLKTVESQSSGPDIVNVSIGGTTDRTILGIGFFMGNSVVYDLANNLTGITSFFVTDTSVETTRVSPVTIGATTGNNGQLGMAGVISGAGDVVVTAGGQAKLSAANTYSGSTRIDADGWLALVGPGSIAQSSGVEANGVFDISGTGIVPGIVGLTTTGASITSLSGTGTVRLGGQTLMLTDASGTFSGSIADGGYAGGTGGGLIIAGGTETLAGASTYTGGTAVAAGATLVLSGSIQGDVVNDGIVQNTGSIAGSVLNTGWLANNGSIGSSVLNDGLLTGNGTIGGGLVVSSGGVVAPGNSIGTLTVAGNVVFQPGSTYRVELGPNGTSDRIEAAGTINVQGGTLALKAPEGTVLGLATFTFFTATGGVTGQFATISDDFATQYPFLSFTTRYGADGLTVQSLRSGVPFTAAAQNASQAAVAGALDTLPLDSPFMDAVVSLNDSSAPAAFTALSGGIYPSVETVLQAQSIYLRDAVTGRLRQAAGAATGEVSSPKTAALLPGLLPTIWTQAYGGWGDGEGSNGVSDVSRSIAGFTAGIDSPIGESARIGIAGGYSQSQFDSATLGSSGDSANYDIALYGSAQFGALGLRLGASYTWHDVSVNRTVAIPGYADALTSSYDADTTQLFADVGYGIATPYADFEPFAAIAYVNLHTDAMSESGGAAALQSGADTQENTFTTLGLRAAKTFAIKGGILTASASLGWQYAFGDTTPVSTLSFESGGAAFQQSGTPIARNAAIVRLGVDIATNPNVTFGFHYAGQLADASQDNAISGRLAIRF